MEKIDWFHTFLTHLDIGKYFIYCKINAKFLQFWRKKKTMRFHVYKIPLEWRVNLFGSFLFHILEHIWALNESHVQPSSIRHWLVIAIKTA